MGAINCGRVVLGGLLAGLIINISQTILNVAVLAQESLEAMKRLNVEPPGPGAIGIFVLMTFLVGVVMIWLYAAMRPRFGPGPKTAVLAGLAVWFLARLLPSVVYVASGMIPAKLMIVACAWGLVEILLAVLAGGWVYKEA